MERDRTVKDYLDLLDEGTGLLLVGGQAVNLWAERYREKESSILQFQPITYADRPMWFLVPPALFQAKLANLKSIDQEGRQDLKHFQLLIPVTRCFFDDLLTQHTSSERPTQAISWMGQHAMNVQEAIKLGHHGATDWSTFFPIKLMGEHPNEAVRNLAKYQLKPNT